MNCYINYFRYNVTIPIKILGVLEGEHSTEPGYQVSTATGLELDASSRLILGPTQPPTQRVQEALSSGETRPGCEADHSPPTSSELENTWIYISTAQYVFME
jgi:hypothetical protein